MPITWREQMSVGVKVLDEDHQHLIDIINQLEQAIQTSQDHHGERKESLLILFGRLKAYTREHFSREEAMQDAADYAGLAENHDHHRRLIHELEELSQRFMDGSASEKPLGKEEMLKFLRHWLVDHIIKIDLKMRGHKIQMDGT